MQRRYGYLKINEVIELGRPGLVVWAYTRRGRFLGRVEINHAGLAAYTGKKGTKRLGDMRWEEFFERLGQKELTAAALSRYVRGVK
jgi:hypothetical protein